MQRLERDLNGLLDRAGGLVDPRIDPLLERGDQLIDGKLGHALTEANCYLTPHFHTRKLLEVVLPRVFPYEFTDWPDQDTFGRIEENRRKGRATIVCVTHFDEGEVLAAIEMIMDHLSNEYLASGVKVIVPVSWHQKNKVGPLGWLGNIDMAHVVNEDTMTKEQAKEKERLRKEEQGGIIFPRLLPNKKLTLGMGVDDYLKKATDAVHNGGTVYVAIQGGRRNQLGEPGIVLGLLLNHLERKGLTNYDILLIGSRLKEPIWVVDETGNKVKRWISVESYIGRQGWNRRCIHEFRAGSFVTREELMTILEGYSAQFGGGKQSEFAKIRQADKWAFDMIRELGLVDPAYLGPQGQ